MAIKRVLCACKGNKDRSPQMAAILQMLLENAGYGEVTCESAGILEVAREGGNAPNHAIKAAKVIGVDLTPHRQRYIGDLALEDFDLFVCADNSIPAILLGIGIPYEKLFQPDGIFNPWPNGNEYDFKRSAKSILCAMYEVMDRYFPAKTQ